MFEVLMFLSVVISIILVVVVLLQSSKGGGLSGIAGGPSMGTMFGTRRTADFLAKFTWWLGGILIGLAFVINLFFLPSSTLEDRESIIQSNQQNIPTQPTVPEQQTPPPTE